MIERMKNADGKRLAEEIAGYISGRRRTNCYIPAEEWAAAAEQGRVLRMDFPGGVYLLLEKPRQFDLFYFLEPGADIVPVPGLGKPVILEQAAPAKAAPLLAGWEAAGFRYYLQRKRLSLPAKSVRPEERDICFCGTAEQAWLERLMAESFEPYTSDLPDAGTLLADLRERRVIAARRDGEWIGFLRFGRERKVSVLRQIAVLPAARGGGTGGKLVRDWLAAEREAVAKFQLWVREDNLPALRMYEKLGFLPDNRIAPVMIAEP